MVELILKHKTVIDQKRSSPEKTIKSCPSRDLEFIKKDLLTPGGGVNIELNYTAEDHS